MYHRLLESTPDHAIGQNNLAWFLATCPDEPLRDPAQAVALAEKAIASQPKHIDFWNTLGVARYRNDDLSGAVEALQKSIELRSGGDSFDWYFLAMIEWRKGHEDEARQWFQQAVDRMETNRPDDDELTRFRAEAAAVLAGPAGK